MFHMKQFDADNFLDLVRMWSKKHNIYGRLDPCELLSQSKESIKNTPELSKYNLLVDVGAGAAWMAVAWLLLNNEKKAFCIEPDPKSASFLLLLKTSFPDLKNRLFIDDRRFELVPRETISSIDSSFALVARAFSPADKLEELIRISSFRSDSFFVFFCDQSLPKGQKYGLKLI